MSLHTTVLVTPGGAAHTLGFSEDLHRMCVGLSRAQDGLARGH